jgi:hypothetical protein
MKLTWFGGTTIRIHIGGTMLVADAAQAPSWIERSELVSGAEIQFQLAVPAGLETVDPASWKPRRLGRAIDDEAPESISIFQIGDHVILVDAVGEQPLVLVTGASPVRPGRWSADAVVVLFGLLESAAAEVLEAFRPRLIALAGEEGGVERIIAAVRDRLDGTGLVALEPGLAVEI